jgi:sugar lactone lactonase YvrE
VYVADHYNHNIQRYTKTGQFVDAFGSFGTDTGKFNRPGGMAFDSTGNVYVTDQQNMRVEVFSETGQFLRTWGTPGSGPGQFSSNEAGLAIAISNQGFAYVADARNQRIQKFNLDGSFVSEWGSGGSGPGQFNFFGGITTNANGNVLVSDFYNNRIQEFDSNGQYIKSWGVGTLSGPAGVVSGADGTLIVADYQRLSAFTDINTIGASYGSSSDQLLKYVYGIDMDSTGLVVLTDPYAYDGKQVKVFQYGNPNNPTNNAVPEPSEWAAMGLLGAGLLGLVVRGRKKNLAN